MWGEGFSWESREHGGVLSVDVARHQLKFMLTTSVSILQWFWDMLDEINEEVFTTIPLRLVGCMACRDELVGTPLWDELSDEDKCEVMYIDDESIQMWIAAVIDGVMSEYDETV